MNQIWGTSIQYDPIVWHYPIAIYLFLAGLSAGLSVVAIFLNDKNCIFAKLSAFFAPLTIILGLILLIFDLKKPLSFYLLLFNFNPSSVMSLGVLALFLYTPLSICFAIYMLENELKNINFLKPFNGVLNLIYKIFFTKIARGVLLICAIAVGAYTGFLLSALNANPLYNTPILPLLFLVSGISAGISTSVLLGVLSHKNKLDKTKIDLLLNSDLKVILLEIMLIFIMFVGMFYGSLDASNVAMSALSVGVLAKVFWFGVVGLGLICPIILAMFFHSYKKCFLILNSILVLLGVFCLRIYILYAGQIFVA